MLINQANCVTFPEIDKLINSDIKKFSFYKISILQNDYQIK